MNYSIQLLNSRKPSVQFKRESRLKKFKILIKFIVNLVKPSNISDGNLLDSTTLQTLMALVSFPSDYTSFQQIPNQIQYTLYTQELVIVFCIDV
jgi:hypothetical protein